MDMSICDCDTAARLLELGGGGERKEAKKLLLDV